MNFLHCFDSDVNIVEPAFTVRVGLNFQSSFYTKKLELSEPNHILLQIQHNLHLALYYHNNKNTHSNSENLKNSVALSK